MRGGAIVVVAAKGAYTGKPRPALVVQSDLFNPSHQSIILCPITSDCVDAPLGNGRACGALRRSWSTRS